MPAQLITSSKERTLATNAAGTAAFPNGSHGVLITLGVSYNTVGGTTSAARDVISGNTNNGVAFSGSTTEYNVVEGDYIGTNAAGTAALGNSANGVFFSSAPYNTIGGTVAGSGDVISGNLSIGVWITSGASDELIEGDYIGTDYTGSHSVPNYNGVQIDAASTANTIGGTTSAARDVISGNSMWGLYITDAGTSGNVVEGDYIGTNGNGTAAVPEPRQWARYHRRCYGKHDRRDCIRGPQHHLWQLLYRRHDLWSAGQFCPGELYRHEREWIRGHS